MPSQNAPATYGEYIESLWTGMGEQREPQTVSRLVAAQAAWLQVPDAEAATARPDLAAIDGWAEKIAATRAFARMMDDPQTAARVAARDAEGLMTDLHGELTGRARDRPAAPERTVEKTKTTPDVPTL